jgi:hypothetical protein
MTLEARRREKGRAAAKREFIGWINGMTRGL